MPLYDGLHLHEAEQDGGRACPRAAAPPLHPPPPPTLAALPGDQPGMIEQIHAQRHQGSGSRLCCGGSSSPWQVIHTGNQFWIPKERERHTHTHTHRPSSMVWPGPAVWVGRNLLWATGSRGCLFQLKHAEGYDKRAKTSTTIRSNQSKLCKHISWYTVRRPPSSVLHPQMIAGKSERRAMTTGRSQTTPSMPMLQYMLALVMARRALLWTRPRQS